MAEHATLLKQQSHARHWQTFTVFCRQWDRAAAAAGLDYLVGHWPSRSQHARWLSGDIQKLPRSEACLVLEAMFKGHTAAALFGPPLPDAPAPSVIVAQPVMDRPADAGPTPMTLAQEIAMSAEESSRFLTGRRATADQETVKQLGTEVRRLAGAYLTDPPYAMVGPLAKERKRVFALLEDRQLPEVIPGLYANAGRLCALLAHACADLGHPYAAETHARTAWVCAEMADDDQLRVYTMWVQSNVAYWTGDFRSAAEAASSGLQYARTASDVLRLTSQQARASAAAHDHQGAIEALEAAREASAAVSEGPASRDGVFHFSAGKASYYSSEVRLALGGADNIARAATDAETAITLLRQDPFACIEFTVAAQSDLAAARLAAAHLEGAAEALHPVLTTPPQLRSAPIAGRARTLITALTADRFGDDPAAVDLRDQLELFVAYSATRELPAG
jgi:hypothetical protein